MSHVTDCVAVAVAVAAAVALVAALLLPFALFWMGQRP